MKFKYFLLVFLILLSFSSLCGKGLNRQKIYPIDSDVYEAINFLYMEQGKSIPSSTGPWSGDELIKMFKRVNRPTLSRGGKATYDYVESVLLKEGNLDSTAAIDFGLETALEGYVHTNTDDHGFFTEERDWIYDFEEREPFLNISFETWATENLYVYFEFPIGVNEYKEKNSTSEIFNNTFTTNVFAIPPNEITDLNMNFPYRAFVSVGGENWNLQLGRDRISWGSGITGNLTVGGHLLYNEFLKFTTYHNRFKFTSVAMAFPHPQTYYAYDSDTGIFSIDPDGQESAINGLRMFISHRLEFRMLDIINFILTESMMYMSTDGTFDLRYLNPAMMYHNFYIRANSNSLLSLETEVNPWENISVYGQMVLDEFAAPGESTTGEKGANPQAFGYLGGIRGILPVGDGIAFAGFEAAKTDPMLYLRGNGEDRNQEVGEIGINYVVGIREFSPDSTISIMEDFLGYEYGNDALVFDLNGGYTVFGKYRIEGNIFYMLHGVHDMYTLWSQGYDSDLHDPTAVETPSDTPADSGNQFADAMNRNAIEHTIALGVKGSYTFDENLDIYAQVDWIHKINPGNLSTNDSVSDTQISLGISYSL